MDERAIKAGPGHPDALDLDIWGIFQISHFSFICWGHSERDSTQGESTGTFHYS